MLLAHNPWGMSTESTAKLSVAVAEEIRVWMTRRRISGERLARQLDVSPAWVSYRINGQVDIKLGELERIADVLNVEVADLLPTPAQPRLNRPYSGLPERPRSKRMMQTQHSTDRTTTTPTNDRPTTPAGSTQASASTRPTWTRTGVTH